jgi:hypothetical protein
MLMLLLLIESLLRALRVDVSLAQPM